jgi:hypothetical protein
LLPSTLIIYPYWGMAKDGVKNGWAWQLLSLGTHPIACHHFFSHIFTVSSIHLNQLQARHQATLHVMAFHQQGLLFDLALLLTGSHFSHAFAVSPIHLNQLQARHWATLHVVAFHWQELLFDLTLSPHFSHTFMVSPIHLNQLQARCQATLHVMAFHWQELLFDLALSLMGSHIFHTLSQSLQSVSINFKLDMGLHFVLWLSVGRSYYLILPY